MNRQSENLIGNRQLTIGIDLSDFGLRTTRAL